MAKRITSTERRTEGGLSRLSGPPLIVQLIGLLVGALIAAQLVTLLLTLVVPPAPPREYALSDIAAALRGTTGEGDRFDRTLQSGPPDLSERGWFVSEASRAKLAGLLARPVGEVAIGFFTQLPVGGTVEPVAAPDRLPGDAERLHQRDGDVRAPDIGNASTATLQPATLFVTAGDGPLRPGAAALFQQMPGGPPGGGFPGGGPPGGGFPGAGLPGGGFPQSLPQPQRQPQPNPQPPRPAQPPATAPSSASPSQPPPAPSGRPAPPVARPDPQPEPVVPRGPPLGLVMPQVQDALTRGRIAPAPAPDTPLDPALPATTPSPEPSRSPAVRDGIAGGADREPPATDVPVAPPARDIPTTIPPTSAAPAPAPAPIGRPVPVVRPQTGLFGLAPAPFVEGDFIAGVRLADGRWAVVGPRAEGFPNAWQRRVALWFLLSLLAVTPIAWLFARRIVGPLNDFAHAADVLGRDPSAAVLPLHGPAEIGRAAHAFNQMQNRLRSFVDDRTAMIGAISHDLRTPLTRLRFRIEDVPEEQQEDLRGEVAEMEEMIASVIAFMRDASIPNARERRDLAEIVDDVIEDAALLGDIVAGHVESAIVDVDPLGVRRVLDNLLTNAMKYGGGHARVVLRIDQDCAVADIVDDGPGVPDAELERVFEPFYRSEAAHGSEREGSGLGLAVCRSIARAHGGDVALFRTPEGFTARVTLPLAFHPDRRVA